ncbi:hypothetical protein J7E63_12915 [Bacillus sp. ISL-75]|nr:hypothetical protein [Bacillus sp. ISL-75]
MDSLYTKQSDEVTYLLNVKFFHKTSLDALIQAEKIANSIRKNKRSIFVLNENGTPTSDTIVFEKIDCSIVADNAAVMKLQWKKEYSYI